MSLTVVWVDLKMATRNIVTIMAIYPFSNDNPSFQISMSISYHNIIKVKEYVIATVEHSH